MRGKILNVEKALEHRIYDNEEIKNMFTALGVSIEEKNGERILNIERLRYHKIVLMADADVDGQHIRTLLLTLLFRFMRPLIEEGYVYLAQPPLYKIKWGRDEHQYAYSDRERDGLLAEDPTDVTDFGRRRRGAPTGPRRGSATRANARERASAVYLGDRHLEQYGQLLAQLR